MTATRQQLLDKIDQIEAAQIEVEVSVERATLQLASLEARRVELHELIESLPDGPPEPPEPPPARNDRPFAIYYEFIYHNPIRLFLARILGEMTGSGAYAILRYPWDRLEQQKGAFQRVDDVAWRRSPEYAADYDRGLDAQIARLRNAGFKIVLKRHGVPRWATVNGTPEHETYECYKARATGDQYDLTKPWCALPGHVIPEELYKHGQFVGTAYGPSVDLFCAGPNEPGLRIYNTLIRRVELGHMTLKEAIGFVMTEQIIPFTEGVRSVVPNARFLSTGADSDTILRLILEYERDHKLHLFDDLGIHAHSWAPDGATSDSFRRIKEFKVVLDELGNGRPEWLDEWEDRTRPVPPIGTHVEFARGAFELLPRAKVIGVHDLDKLFTPDSWFDPINAGPPPPNAYVPSETHKAIQKYVEELAKVTA